MSRSWLSSVLYCVILSTAVARNGNAAFGTAGRELLVMFAPNAVSIPGGQTSCTLAEAIVSTTNIYDVLATHEVEAISSTFPTASPSDTIAYARTGEPVRRFDYSQIKTLRFPEGSDVVAIANELTEDPNVLFAEPNGIAIPDRTPNDSLFYNNQWNLWQHTNPSPKDIGILDAWDTAQGSPNVTLALIDGGLDDTNGDLIGRFATGGDPGWANYPPEAPDTLKNWNGHGFLVGGVAAASGDNGRLIAGIDWRAKLLSYRLDGCDNGVIPALLASAANSGADVVNNSYHFLGASLAIRLGFADWYRQNRVAVAASGNIGPGLPTYQPVYPGAYPNVISVGAYDELGQQASWSNRWSGLTLLAPGENIASLTPYPPFYWAVVGGTSVAAPHASGIATLLLGQRPDLANDDITQRKLPLSVDS